ncbi:MAG: SHOCT domain-containing protein [Elusimicrobiota bacterium]
MWVILILVVVVFLYSLEKTGGQKSGGKEKSSPLEILKKRYARGDISKEEFEEKKKDIL